MTLLGLLRRPTALIPLMMSCGAFLLTAGVLATTGITSQPDEGAPARLFQLLIALQTPVVGFFGLTWLPKAPRPALVVLALQIGAVVSAIATIMWLERGA